MSMKRTYSRRDRAHVPATFNLLPNDTGVDAPNPNNKRLKLSPRDRAGASSQAIPSGHPARQKKAPKKFGGPVSMRHDDTDLDVVAPVRRKTRELFSSVLDQYKAGNGTAARHTGALHGSREDFETLIKQKENGNGTNGKSALMRGGGQQCGSVDDDEESPPEDVIASPAVKGLGKPGDVITSPDVQAGRKPDATNVSLRKERVLAMAKQVFKNREYQAPPRLPPSRDLLKKRINSDSEKAAVWSQNQISSPLFRLPKNVRSRIYEYALGGRTVEIYFMSYKKIERDGGRVDRIPYFKYDSIVCREKRHPQYKYGLPRIEKSQGMSLLSGVCRQLYRETSTLPYQLNKITFHANNTLFNFIVMEHRLRSDQLAAITELSVREDLPAPSVLVLLPNLERVNVLPGLKYKEEEGDWKPPSTGWYRVVQGKKGREFEKESVWSGSDSSNWNWR